MEAEINIRFSARAEDIPTLGLASRGVEMTAGEPRIRMRLELKADRGIK